MAKKPDFKNRLTQAGGGLTGMLAGGADTSKEPEIKTTSLGRPSLSEDEKVDKPINVIIGKSIHTAFKIKCTQEDRRMRDVLEELIKAYLEKE